MSERVERDGKKSEWHVWSQRTAHVPTNCRGDKLINSRQEVDTGRLVGIFHVHSLKEILLFNERIIIKVPRFVLLKFSFNYFHTLTITFLFQVRRKGSYSYFPFFIDIKVKCISALLLLRKHFNLLEFRKYVFNIPDFFA